MAGTNFESYGEFLGNKYNYVDTQDWYPFHNQWRGQPLNPNRAFIRNNAAGLYPYNKEQRTVRPVPESKWEYAWYYPCNTIFPSNPQYLKNGTIILER